jgi:hypothetical protein
MTLNTFAPPSVDEAPAVQEPASTSRRTVLVAGGVAAALALGGGGYVLLSGGSDTPADTAITSPLGTRHLVTPTVKKQAKPAVKPVVKVPPTSTVPLGRDPFHALYLLPVVSAPTAQVAPTTTTPGTTTTSTGSTGSTTSNPAPPTSTAPKSYKLVLTRVYGSGKDMTGVFSVGGKTMVAKVGSVFGPTQEIRLFSLAQNAKGVWTATIQVGDSEPLDAVKGQAIYVQ